MIPNIDLDALLMGCADDSFDNGIRIDTELEPLSGPGGTIKPAVYAGGVYQKDHRWADPGDAEPMPVIVIDNVPSQANRLEDALRRNRESTLIPEFVLDLSEFAHLPAHIPRRLSSLQFPHRNADAYLRDSRLDDKDFMKTELGKAIFDATAQKCGLLMAWFPQSLLYGFWQSHLGKKRTSSKHARAWVSEIIGWQPASTDTKVLGLKRDPLNLSIDKKICFDADDQTKWRITAEERGKLKGGKSSKGQGALSEIGHGQALFRSDGQDATAAAVSFARVTQRATVSFAHLRRISLGPNWQNQPQADIAVRALLVALGLHAHQLAFGRGFALRSGAELQPQSMTVTWLGSDGDDACNLGDATVTQKLLQSARKHAEKVDVPLDGWGKQKKLLPKDNLAKAICSTWPKIDG